MLHELISLEALSFRLVYLKENEMQIVLQSVIDAEKGRKNLPQDVMRH